MNNIETSNTDTNGHVKIIDYLYEQLQFCLDKDFLHETNKGRKNIGIEAELCLIFSRYIVGSHDAERPDFIKVDEAKFVYFYNGLYFAQVDKIVLESAIKEVMLKLGVGAIYAVNSHKKILEEIYLGLCSNTHCELIPSKRYIAFNNCVLDLDTMQTYKHDISFNCTMIMDFDYEPSARDDRWEQFLDEVLPTLDYRYALQEFCGSIFVDRYKYKIEKACYLLGEGNNGKSVFMTVLTNILGEENISTFSPEMLFKGQTVLYNIASVSGKIVNICDDASDCDISGGDYKSFVSGAPFQARNPYGLPFKVKKIPLMMVGVNRMPVTKDDSKGYHRRTLIIAFDKIIADEDVDVTLPTKLTQAKTKSAVMNWILEGRKKFVLNNGKFTQYAEVKALQRQAKEQSNNVLRWVSYNGYVAVSQNIAQKTVTAKELYQNYVEYCKENGEMPRSATGFGRLLQTEGFIKQRNSIGFIYYLGLKVESDIDDDILKLNQENLPF